MFRKTVNFACWIFWILLINWELVEVVLGAEDDAPQLELLEIVSSPDNSQNELIRQVSKGKNSEIIIGEDVSPHSRIVIKCNASYPIQIIYVGSGRPEFTTFTNVKGRSGDPSKPLTFEAEASLGLLGFQGALRVEDTGNYTCRSIQNYDNSSYLSYYYIFVPGPALFTPPEDYDPEIHFTSNDKTIWIPCAAAHPKAVVSLHKTASGKPQCPAIGKNLAVYDPRKGFLLNLKDHSLKKPEGNYLCIGSLNESNFKMIEYKLTTTNITRIDSSKNNATSSTGKDPCRPSPCGLKAECSIMDGHPVCYCFRGLSGNPYNECSYNKDRCQSNAECQRGQYCVQNRCTSDPCNPSPCGKGATCIGHRGRPECSCDVGWEGKPPYCLKKCQYNGDCPENEICTKNKCINPCKNQCGPHADCQVVQSTGYNRATICTCPPGFTGDPNEKCYDVGADPSQSIDTHCPIGFIGPGPPNCKRKECSDNYDCPPNNYCSAEKQCVENGDVCSRTCGVNAVCQLTRSLGGSSSARPICSCPLGTSGDPFVECFNFTSTSIATASVEDPCDPNPCPRNGVCKVRYRFGRHDFQNGIECLCPPGQDGQPPNCFPNTGGRVTPIPVTVKPSQSQQQCFEDPDCPRGHECVARLCIPSDENETVPETCRTKCGLNAQCVNSRCVCPSNMFGDPRISCSTLPSPCDPSPCANFAECREINERAACRCILGYEGDAFSRCSPASGTLSGRQNEDSLRPGYLEDDHYRYKGSSRFSNRPSLLTHSPSTITGNGLIRASASRNFNSHHQEIPEGVIYGRYCSKDGDCRPPEVCSNSTFNCYNPCDDQHSPCASVKNSECRVIEGRSLCSCRRGYIGNPSSGLDCRRDFGDYSSATNQDPIVNCDLSRGTGCNSKSNCKLIEGQGRCVCGVGYVGAYPDCRLTCQQDRDCYNAEQCRRNECVNPCERNPCGRNAFCSVRDHQAVCQCPPEWTGNAWIECKRFLRDGRQDAHREPFHCRGSKCSLF